MIWPVTAPEPVAMKVSQLLDMLWDPIGVYQGPPEDWAPFGEYESYVSEILNALGQGRSTQSIAAFLRGVATGLIGVEATGSEQDVAERLVAWYRDLPEHT